MRKEIVVSEFIMTLERLKKPTHIPNLVLLGRVSKPEPTKYVLEKLPFHLTRSMLQLLKRTLSRGCYYEGTANKMLLFFSS
jgi:hypothetical protein